jgi:SAM-dependent methyltransferase
MVDAGEIDLARFKGVLRGDATKLPFADNSFDVVITSEVLEHIQDDVAAIAEMVRVLKPGGHFAATVPAWFPEKINWMLSDEYHAPKSEGGHVRIYSSTELSAKLRTAGLHLTGRHRAHALHSPYWWLKCAVGPRNDDHPAVRGYREFLEWDIMEQPDVDEDRRSRAVAGDRQEHRLLRHQAGRTRTMSHVPDLPGVLSADELHATGEHLASLQLDSGMIPWFPGGHCDPWNHVETAMALDVAGFHDEAERAYEWLVDTQRPDGSWHAYYRSDGTVEDAKLDTNVCAYIATGVCHHVRLTWDRGFADNMWPTVERALEFVLSLRRSDGVPVWAIEPEAQPWDYALLTGTSSIQHALRCGARLAESVGEPRPGWLAAADRHGRRRARPSGRVRTQDPLGDGLVLPGPHRRPHGRGGEEPARRGLGHLRHGGPRHPVRERRTVDHRLGDGRVRAGVRGDR